MSDFKRLAKIEIALAKKGLKRYEAAAKSGITPGTLGSIITGRVNATEKEKKCIAEVLGVTVSEIFD